MAIILDVGPEMALRTPDGPSYFEQSVTAIDMILQRKVTYLFICFQRVLYLEFH